MAFLIIVKQDVEEKSNETIASEKQASWVNPGSEMLDFKDRS